MTGRDRAVGVGGMCGQVCHAAGVGAGVSRCGCVAGVLHVCCGCATHANVAHLRACLTQTCTDGNADGNASMIAACTCRVTSAIGCAASTLAQGLTPSAPLIRDWDQ